MAKCLHFVRIQVLHNVYFHFFVLNFHDGVKLNFFVEQAVKNSTIKVKYKQDFIINLLEKIVIIKAKEI